MKKALILLLTLFIISCGADQRPIGEQINDLVFPIEDVTVGSAEEETISIMSFNIQVFGRSKMSKPEVVEILVDIISQYDLIAIQEIRDSSGEAIQQLVNLLPTHYALEIAPREGRTQSKEQYAFIYDVRKFVTLNDYVYEDVNDVFERSPYAVYFSTIDGVFDFVVVNNHISPGDAEAEIAEMPRIIEEIEMLFNEPDIISVGDFNADGSYFPEEELSSIFYSYEYLQLIGNEIDTTVAVSDNTYDRIMVTNEVEEDWTGVSGIFDFGDYYDFSSLTIEEKEVSDHYPIFAEFYINRDTD
jgi:deoxyribonuclease-1-like protein